MALFKEKKKKKSKDNIEPTLDAKHKDFLSKIEETKNSLPHLENRLKNLQNDFEKIDKIPMYELSDEEMESKFQLKESIDGLKSEIKNIYNNNDENGNAEPLTPLENNNIDMNQT